MGNTRQYRRLSRRQREQLRRRRLMLMCAVVVALVVVLVVLIAKGCNSGTRQGNTATTGNVSGSMADNKNDGSSAGNEAGNAANNADDNVGAQQETTADTSGEYSPNGFKIETIDGVTYVGGVLIANKTYALPSTFVPTNPEVPVTEQRSNTSLDKDLMTAWRTMQKDATASGLNIYISSGYRSYSYQVALYNRYVSQDGKAMADTYSSRPGSSEHQTGLCFDLNSIDDSFAATAEGKWINDNCYKYGFCIRFPKGKDAYTGYKYESWHLRYVGEELATKLYNNGDWISLEEYLGITSEYTD